MKITNIKQQVKNPQRVSIFTDGKYALSLSLNELLEQKIKNGDELDEARLIKLKRVSEDGKLRVRSLEWVLNRPRSIREFKDYLHRKKAEPELVEKFTEEFLSRGYLDERKFTSWLVELRVGSGKSNRAIAAELASKGVDREMTEEILAAAPASEEARIKEVIAKKSKVSRYKSNPQKLIEYLARQGFNYDLIKENLKSGKT